MSSSFIFRFQKIKEGCPEPRKVILYETIFYSNKLPPVATNPSIAQLVERRTVEGVKASLGRWFESGSKDLFFKSFFFLF